MQLNIRPATPAEYFDFFVHSFPGGGKSAFVLGTYWEKNDERGGPIIFDFDGGGIEGTAVDLGLTGKVPIITLTKEEEVFYSCVHYQDVIQQVNATAGFENYQVDVLAYDTISSMEELIMGDPARSLGIVNGVTEGLPGSGLMGRTRKRDETYAPHPADYKAVMSRTKALLRKLHSIPMHTIATAHTVRAETINSKRGLNVAEQDKEHAFFPNLIGDSRYTAMKLHDFYLYLEQRGGQFYATTRPKDGGGQARTRYQSKLRPEVLNPKFRDFVAIAKGEK